MKWDQFYEVAVPQYIRDREAGKNRFVAISRWFSSRQAYVLYHLGVTGNFISGFRILLGLFALGLYAQIGTGNIALSNLGILLMAWQLNLDGVDGALARTQGKESEFGDAYDNLGIDYVRASLFALFGFLSGSPLLLILTCFSSYVMVPFRQYTCVERPAAVDPFIKNFIYIPILAIVIPLILNGLIWNGLSITAVFQGTSILYSSLAAVWLVFCIYTNTRPAVTSGTGGD